MAKPLTYSLKQEIACQKYIELRNKSKAYRVAYNCTNMTPATVNRRAFDLFEMSKIKARVAELQAKIARKAELTLRGQVKKLDRTSNFDYRKIVDANGVPVPLQDLGDDEALAFQEIKIRETYDKEGNRTVEHFYKIPPRIAATDLENKIIGAYAEDNAQKAHEIKILQQYISIFGPETQERVRAACEEKFGLTLEGPGPGR